MNQQLLWLQKEKNQYCKPWPDSEGVRVEFPTKGFWQCPRIHLHTYRFVHSLFPLVFFGGHKNVQICFYNSGHDVGVKTPVLKTGGLVPSNIWGRIQTINLRASIEAKTVSLSHKSMEGGSVGKSGIRECGSLLMCAVTCECECVGHACPSVATEPQLSS